MIRCVILSSGNGAVVQGLIDSAALREIPGLELTACISAKAEAQALSRARAAGVRTYVIERDVFPNEATFKKAVDDKLVDLDTDLIVLSGFAAPLSGETARRYFGRIIMTRPLMNKNVSALAIYEPSYFDAASVSVCFADESGAPGREVRRQSVPRLADDTPETLARRVLEVGANELLDTVKTICRDSVK